MSVVRGYSRRSRGGRQGLAHESAGHASRGLDGDETAHLHAMRRAVQDRGEKSQVKQQWRES